MSTITGPASSKDISLEGVRGIAALVVFVWHFLFAFNEAFLFDPAQGIVGSPFFAFFHGTAAIDVFFLLSGFVLTQRFFQTGDPALLVMGAFKRWLRLMPVALCCVLLSWCCYHFGWYHFIEAGHLVRSNWLILGAGAYYPPVDPEFGSALWQGLIGVFLLGEVNFDTSLWTLRIELFGSFIAFALAWALARFQGRSHALYLLFLLICAAGLAAVDLHYLAFLIGTVMASQSSRLGDIGKGWGLALLLLGLFLLGYRAPIGLYSVFMPFAYFVQRDSLYTIFSLIGGSMLLLSCLGWKGLNSKMHTACFRFLGQVSYPLYAIHIVVICSLGAGVFVRFAREDLFVARLMAALAVFPTTFALAYILSRFDQAWVRNLNMTVAAHYARLRSFRRRQA